MYLKYLTTAIFIFVIAAASGCYRLPADFSYNLKRVADTNEALINHPDFNKMSKEEQNKELKSLLQQTDKDILNAVKTIEAGK